MKFLCDVHIPYNVRTFLSSEGYIAVHVNELPDKSHTKDGAICS